MKLRQLLKLNCAEAEKLCDKAQYKEASLLDRTKLRFHLLFCGTCKEYTQKNLKLTILLKKASLKTCTKLEKERHKKKIEDHL